MGSAVAGGGGGGGSGLEAAGYVEAADAASWAATVPSRTLVRRIMLVSIAMTLRMVGEGERERERDSGSGTWAAAATSSGDPGGGGGFMAEDLGLFEIQM
jgi:hypothetical protein